jgi:hypothetical protein
MASNLARLPDYTCLQTIRRMERRIPARRFELMDTLRLEVALIGGNELFSWPGATAFDDKDGLQIVPGGLIGKGNFALHARIVFQSSAPRFTYAGERMLDGRRCVGWNYSVERWHNSFVVRVSGREATLASHGSFWADAKTLDVVRLEVEGDEIPPEFELLGAGDSVDYTRLKIGDDAFLLAHSAESHMLDSHNNESVNRILFTSCRQYLGETKLSFGDPMADGNPPAPIQSLQAIEIPVGMTLYLALETRIDSEASAAGDSIAFKLQRDLKLAGRTLFEKGSPVSGRLTLLRRTHLRSDGYSVGIRLSGIRSAAARAALTAILDEIPVLNNSSIRGPEQNRAMFAAAELPKSVGSAFFQPGKSVTLPRGTLMVWHTVPPASDREGKHDGFPPNLQRSHTRGCRCSLDGQCLAVIKPPGGDDTPPTVTTMAWSPSGTEPTLSN